MNWNSGLLGCALLVAVGVSGGTASARYLQPEPLLQNPQAVTAYSSRGIPLNPYTYAANNPLRYFDPNGREVRLGPSCVARNPLLQTYLANMSLSCTLQRRQPAPVCTAGAAKGEQFPTSAIERLLNDPRRVVTVECSDSPVYNSKGARVWAYTSNTANQINIYGGGWDAARGARTLAHEVTHAALNTQFEWTPDLVEACTSSSGTIRQ